LKGHFLVASPSLLDPNFFRAVVLVLEDGAEGSVGLVVNRPTEATVTRVSEQVFQEQIEWDKAISLGGPVPGPLIALHTTESFADQEIAAGLFRTSDPAKLEQVVRQQVEPSLLIANCAGWGPGQLAAEIEADSWLALPARPEHVFWSQETDLWTALVKEVSTAKLSQLLKLGEIPGDPAVN
jgi:putative transcriptional regulator